MALATPQHVNEYLIYCDESTLRGQYYSNFYGGAIIYSKDLKIIVNKLVQKKQKLNLHQEVKWSKVTSNYCDKYIQLMDCFFDLIRQNKIKIRIMFTQNVFVANNLSQYHREHEYFLLYYQFVKHAFGLQYANNNQASTTNIRVYFDKLPDTKEKAERFKSHIHSLSASPAFRRANTLILQNQIAEVQSHEHVILQCLDIVLGAMQFRLNNKHLEKQSGIDKRAKRTIAKEKLYKYINQQIQRVYPRFNIGCTTSSNGDPKNSWIHPYRHWLFKPKNRKIDLSKAKKQKNSRQ